MAKPSDLSDYASAMWDTFISHAGVVARDELALQMACETWARWREAVDFRKERGVLGRNSQGVVTAPWVGVEERAARDFRGWCAEFGLTPAARGDLIANAERATQGMPSRQGVTGLDEFTQRLQQRSGTDAPPAHRATP
ncbi:MAG: P27 family phage terminase small subunit [Propionibacteriales bacterium]|nr:P27 family phage terminase small subunit [Propionibacteriales bacterium]